MSHEEAHISPNRRGPMVSSPIFKYFFSVLLGIIVCVVTAVLCYSALLLEKYHFSIDPSVFETPYRVNGVLLSSDRKTLYAFGEVREEGDPLNTPGDTLNNNSDHAADLVKKLTNKEREGHILTFDLSNPNRPILASDLVLIHGGPETGYMRRNKLFLSSVQDYYHATIGNTWNLGPTDPKTWTDPLHSRILSSTERPLSSPRMKMMVIDISSSLHPQLAATIDGKIFKISFDGNKAFVGGAVYDVTDPAHSKQIAYDPSDFPDATARSSPSCQYSCYANGNFFPLPDYRGRYDQINSEVLVKRNRSLELLGWEGDYTLHSIETIPLQTSYIRDFFLIPSPGGVAFVEANQDNDRKDKIVFLGSATMIGLSCLRPMGLMNEVHCLHNKLGLLEQDLTLQYNEKMMGLSDQQKTQEVDYQKRWWGWMEETCSSQPFETGEEKSICVERALLQRINDLIDTADQGIVSQRSFTELDSQSPRSQK